MLQTIKFGANETAEECTLFRAKLTIPLLALSSARWSLVEPCVGRFESSNHQAQVEKE